MSETNGITSHSHMGSHNITQCIHSEEIIQKKEPVSDIKAGAENQIMNQSTENNSPRESASFLHTAVAQVKNAITKGIGFFKNFGAQKAAAPSTEIQSLGYGEVIGTTQQNMVEPKSIVESAPSRSVNSALEANKVGTKENFGLAGLKEQLQNAGKNRKLAEAKKREELQIKAEKTKGIAIDNNYLLDSYNKNGEYTRMNSEDNKFSYRR